jgi:putative hydrolase of the HAD superfamily
MSLPKVIFLDAVGTLFGVKGSVGEIYSHFAHQSGVGTEPQEVDWAFYKSFKAAPPMAFPEAPKTDVPHLEYVWWRTVAKQTFRRVGVLEQFADFEGFFTGLYQHFTTAAPWFVYTDTLRSLNYWQASGVELGVISNFDSRLYPVLDALGLGKFFQTITISTDVGVAKPHRLIFETALAKHQCSAEQAWHIGDSEQEDFQGATAAGLHGVWLKRPMGKL